MTAALGFTVKSGWASAVLLAGPATAPSVADVRRVELSDPSVPDSSQPYHAGFGTARAAGPGLRTLVSSAKRFGRQSVTRLIRSHESSGHTLHGAGVVVGSLIDPATIANDHIRIHALEGRLFRGVVTNAIDRCGLACAIWRERDLYGIAAATLKRPEPELRRLVAVLGRDMPGPWRAEHKAAALAAWLVLGAGAAAPKLARDPGRAKAGARD